MNGVTILLVVLSVVLLAIIYLLVFRKELFTPRKKDLSGAAAVSGPLAAAKRMAHLNGYQVIAPAKLAKDGRFADLDFIIVGCFGLLCVKCIGRGGDIYGSAGDAMWLQVRGGERISFANPLREAEADTRVVRDTLFAAKLKNTPVETVCVFTNPHAALALPRSTGHYTVKEFRALLGKDRLQQDRHVEIDAAAQAVRKFLAEV